MKIINTCFKSYQDLSVKVRFRIHAPKAGNECPRMSKNMNNVFHVISFEN